MSKLWIIGDSFSAAFKSPNEGPDSYKNRYSKFKGYYPKFFGDFISESLGLEYSILTNSGPHDNNRMLECFIDNMDLIKEGDIVSFGWTTTNRLSFVDTKSNQWIVMNAHNMTGDYCYDFSVKSLIEFAINRDHYLYENQLKKWMKLVNKSIPNVNVIHWSWTNNTYFTFETIEQETNGLINDFHWSENGHQKFAEWFLNVLNKKIENNCYKL
jgi:hypothetical protein